MSRSAPAALIRQWAFSAGISVGARGRLAPEVLSAYAAAHPQATEGEASVRRLADAPVMAQGFRIAARPVPDGAVGGRRVRARAD